VQVNKGQAGLSMARLPNKIMRYFLAENANRKLLNEVVFEPIDLFAGTVRGVYSTKYDTLAGQLTKEPGVREITEADYSELLKKKSPSLDSSLILRMPSPDSQARLANPPRVVVDDTKKKQAKLPTTADALKVEKVSSEPEKVP
jgi:hypothetical protein